VRTRLAERNVRLDLKLPAKIGTFVADEKRVRQVLFNLLSNAVGFSPQGEKVTLSAERTRDAIVFRIADRGPGIPPETTERLFEKFYRGDNRQTGGLGLGLSIARGLIEAHGGKLTVENRDGGGARFTIRLPVRVTDADKLEATA
jgi:signal transduction histidine kinase